MLIRALSCKPQLLVLDEPFEGLDVESLAALQAHLNTIATNTTIVTVLNRLDQCPDYVTHLAYVNNGELQQQVSRKDTQDWQQLHDLLHLKTADLAVPPADPDSELPTLDPQAPLVRITNGAIKYDETVIFDKLDWTINQGGHWQLTGPNGSGKTALLSLITGDHPQCYVNDIFVFGFQRGSGESIWQIKQFIGYVSTALQWEYTVGTSEVLGLQSRADETFTSQSYGDQRLLLIARAMVKHPPLLILDEPCLGLDDMNRQRVLALIELICSRSNSTVLYVNHHAEDKIAGIDNYLALDKLH